VTEELTLIARGREISGWTDVSVTRVADAFPNSFTIGMSWHDPVTDGAVVAAAGDPCEVRIGGETVITGYIDQDVAGGGARNRFLRLVGRGKCQDLVDCVGEANTMQLLAADALTISKALAAPYGIDVVMLNGATPGKEYPRWAQQFEEHSAEIIQRLAQNANLMAYEDALGRLAFAVVGTARAASGVRYGDNVEEWSVQHSMNERYSEVQCASLAIDVMGDIEGSNFFATERDPNVPRHRRAVIVLQEVAEDAQAFTIRKARWEVTRRAGRSTVATVTIDSWRDSAGALWAPNTLVPVQLPGLRTAGPDMILAEVTFRRDSSGTHADLVLMPPEAFAIEPVNPLPTATAELLNPFAVPQP